MKNIINAFQKQKLNIYFTNGKRSSLNEKKPIPGRVLSVIFNDKTTSFEISNFVKTLKNYAQIP